MANESGGAGAPEAGDGACLAGVGAVRSGRGRSQARVRREYVKREWARKLAAVQYACRRISEAGETITEICRDPQMPGRSTFMAWLAREPVLADLVAEAEAAEAFTPRRDYHYWDEAVAEEFLARIEDGRGLREVCAERDMPVHSTITRWLSERPAFAARYRQAREAQADRLFDLAWRIALEATPGEVETARLKIQTLKWRIGRLAPRVYGPQKAQTSAEDRSGGNAAAVGRFVVGRWAVDPQGRMVEYTWAALGRSQAEIKALADDIRAGRLSAEEAERLGDARRAACEAEEDRARG